MPQQFDLVVIGAGPGGLLAAKTAAEEGLSTVLLEQRHDISTLTRTCCESLLAPGERSLNTCLTNEPGTSVYGFEGTEISFVYSGPTLDVYGMHHYAHLGGTALVGLPALQRPRGVAGRIALSFDKAILLSDLLAQAEGHGAHLRLGTRATGLTQRDGSVAIHTNHGTTYTGRFAIAADGTNSRMAQALGFNAARTHVSSVNAVGFVYRGLRVPRQSQGAFCCLHARQGQSGAMAAVLQRPYENQYSVAFLSMDHRVDLMAYKDWMSTQSNFRDWFDDADCELVSSAACNAWHAIARPVRDNVLLVGDACFNFESENYGALLAGGKAALAVAEALDRGEVNDRGVASYLEWYDGAYYSNPETPRNQTGGGLATGFALDDEQMSYFYKKLNLSTPRGTYQTNEAGKILRKLAEPVMPEIQRERPDVVAGLMARRRTETLLKDISAIGYANR